MGCGISTQRPPSPALLANANGMSHYDPCAENPNHQKIQAHNGSATASCAAISPQTCSALDNILLLTDSYKVTHYAQYPPKTEKIYSYFESRGGKYVDCVWFGLQYFLKRYLVGQVVTSAKIAQAEAYYSKHFGTSTYFNQGAWRYILEKHGGRLPVSIKAVPEGMIVSNRNVLMTIENTDPQCFWLTNFLETLLVQVWYPMTVCTNSREQKKIILHFLNSTGDISLIPNRLHDFGFRGSTSVESAALGDAAHLVNFVGTDTIPGLVLAREYYSADMAGISVPASEHSTMTAWGKDNEVNAYGNMLQSYPSGALACVSDSYNIFEACERIWGTELREQVMQRNGTLFIRPDSGDPKTVVLKVLDILGEKFGTRTNDKGFRILDDHVRIIQGDGVSPETMTEILVAMKDHAWSADNIIFGSGGALLQKFNRDTLKCAFKCSYAIVDGKPREVFKDPVTDPGKASKHGRLALVKDAGTGQWATQQNADDNQEDMLMEVFRDGVLLRDWTWDEVKLRAEVKRDEYETLTLPVISGAHPDN